MYTYINSRLFPMGVGRNCRRHLLRYLHTPLALKTYIFLNYIPGPYHTFRALKRGIKNLFDRWHLDSSNMRVFLDQTRIFRPPCVNITGLPGMYRVRSAKEISNQVCQWSISDFTMVNLFVYYYSRLPNLSKTCHFDNLLTNVRSVIDQCDTIAIAD